MSNIYKVSTGGGSGIETITSNNLLITPSGTTVDIEDLRFTTAYVVDTATGLGDAGTYTSVTAALAAIAAGPGAGTIFVRPNITLNESFTVPENVTITGYPQTGTNSNNTIITGTVTLTPGSCIANLTIKPRSPALCIGYFIPIMINPTPCFVKNVIMYPTIEAISSASSVVSYFEDCYIFTVAGSSYFALKAGTFYWNGGSMRIAPTLGGGGGISMDGTSAILNIKSSSVGAIISMTAGTVNMELVDYTQATLSGSAVLNTTACTSNFNGRGNNVALTGNSACSFNSNYDVFNNPDTGNGSDCISLNIGLTATITNSSFVG